MSEQKQEGRVVLVDKINQLLGQLTVSVNIDIKNNLSTRNVLAENILAGLLNRMEGWKLINANRIRSNYPAVDLVDMENRIAVQVTSTNGAEKIRHTLEEFEKNDLGKDYDRLYVVIITTDNPTPSMCSRSIPGIFSGKTDIWNIPTLEGKLMDLPVLVLEGIHSYLTEELGKVDGSRPYLYLPPDSALGDGFVGREAELLSIRSQLDQGVKPVVLSGLGGIGKTVLASRFGRMYPDGEVYFIRFQNSFTATITGLYGKISPAPLQPPSEKEQLEAVMNILGRCTEKDLLIFDNVDADSGDLSDLMHDEIYKKLKQMKPRMLLTTRFEQNRAISVGRIDPEDLKEIFRTHGADLTDTQMDNLIEAVNGHTITIDLMARTLADNWVPVSPGEMLDALHDNSLAEMDFAEIDADYGSSPEQKQIYQHLRAVFNVAKIPSMEQSILHFATLLPEDGMDLRLFRTCLDKNLLKTFPSLGKRGWLMSDGQTLRIHPVVRLVCRVELKPSVESCTTFLDALWGHFDEIDYNYTKYSQMAELFAVAAGQLDEKKAVWINHAGTIWLKLVLSHQANALYQKYLCEIEKDFPGECILAESYSIHGRVYGQLGYHKMDLDLQLKALKIREKILSPNDPDIAASYINAGTAYGYLGNNAYALEAKLKALGIRQKYLPPKSLLLADSYESVGKTYDYMGKYSEALEYKEKALNIRKEVLPENHPDTAKSHNSVGSSYGNLGDHETALAHKLIALKIQKSILPPKHPDIASSYENVGSTYGHLENHEEALAFKMKSLEIREEILRPDHPLLAGTYDNIGRTHIKLGNYEMAEHFILKALRMREIILQNDHPDLARSYNSAGILYRKTGNHSTSLTYLEKSLEIRNMKLAKDHPDIAYTYYSMGLTYVALNERESALCNLKKALSIWESRLPSDHSSIIKTRIRIQELQQ